jgi:hypothetical protein
MRFDLHEWLLQVFFAGNGRGNSLKNFVLRVFCPMVS